MQGNQSGVIKISTLKISTLKQKTAELLTPPVTHIEQIVANLHVHITPIVTILWFYQVALDLKVHQALVDQQVPRDLPVEKEEKEKKGPPGPQGKRGIKGLPGPPGKSTDSKRGSNVRQLGKIFVFLASFSLKFAVIRIGVI